MNTKEEAGMKKWGEIIRTVMMYLPSRNVSIMHTVTIPPRIVKLQNFLFGMDLEILPSLGPLWADIVPGVVKKNSFIIRGRFYFLIPLLIMGYFW